MSEVDGQVTTISEEVIEIKSTASEMHNLLGNVSTSMDGNFNELRGSTKDIRDDISNLHTPLNALDTRMLDIQKAIAALKPGQRAMYNELVRPTQDSCATLSLRCHCRCQGLLVEPRRFSSSQVPSKVAESST